MSKILWLTTSSMNTEPVIGSLESVEDFEFEIAHIQYDRVPEGSFFDEQLMLDVDKEKPDAVLYIGSMEGPYLARSHVFKNIQGICPIVHIVFDGACPKAWPTLKRFREDKAFSLTVNIDGNQDWPKGENDMTTLCPIDPRPYGVSVDKTIRFGFCGGSASSDRQKLIEKLGEQLVRQERDEAPGSYQKYADFMLRCKSVVNMARSGSGESMQVKARVVEAGLAGCALFEPKGSPTKNYLENGKHYFQYDNADDLLELLLDLSDDDLGEAGFALMKRITFMHSPKQFYEKVFKKIGLEISYK